MPLQAVKLPISHNNVVGENTVLRLNTSLQNVSVENLQFKGRWSEDILWTENSVLL